MCFKIGAHDALQLFCPNVLHNAQQKNSGAQQKNSGAQEQKFGRTNRIHSQKMHNNNNDAS
jgi:hypothetical protein